MTTNEAIQEFMDNAYHESLKPEISVEAKVLAIVALQEKLERETRFSGELANRTRIVIQKCYNDKHIGYSDFLAISSLIDEYEEYEEETFKQGNAAWESENTLEDKYSPCDDCAQEEYCDGWEAAVCPTLNHYLGIDDFDSLDI